MNESFNELAPLLSNLHLSRQRIPSMFKQSLTLSVLYLHYNSGDIFRYSRDSFTELLRPFFQPETTKMVPNNVSRNVSSDKGGRTLKEGRIFMY